MGCFKRCLALTFAVLACVFASTCSGATQAEDDTVPTTAGHLTGTPDPPNSDDTKPLWNATWTDKLKRKLLTHYDKFARPAQHTNATVVKMGLTFRHIELDEVKSVMTVHGWMKMVWTDEKLKWNQTEWGGLHNLHLADHEIWQPDIILYNSASGSSIDHYGNSHCIVYPTGEVIWVPPAQFFVFCDLDLRLWPYDTQICHLTFGSWTYDGDQVDLQLGGPFDGFEMELWNTNSEWQIENVKGNRTEQYYSCCPEPYVDITYNITLRRRSPAYSAIVITPAAAIVLMTLAGFWLPPNAGEKILLNGCTAIIICLFLLYFSQKLPAMAGHTPLVVLFYSSSLHLVILSLVVTVVVLNLSRNCYSIPVPWVLQSLLLGWPGRILGLHHIVLLVPSAEDHREICSGTEDGSTEASSSGVNVGIADDSRQVLTRSSSHRRHQVNWILLAISIDRLCFLLYCLLFIILATVYSV